MSGGHGGTEPRRDTPHDEPGLALRDVVVRYGSTTAVAGVSLAVPRGQVVALLGPSGCGKSSLLRAVAGLEPLAAGSVTWDGQSLAGVAVHRRGFGLLFQDGQLFAHRDVAGNVAYGLPRGPAGAVRVAQLLDLVGLPGAGGRDVATLSGGERQRVALARALAPAPRLLLLDEPLSALDRALRERLAADLRAILTATRTTAVLVTHDQDEAFALADRVAVMSAGRLLQVDPPEVLWRRPASREVAAFLGYEAFVPAEAPVAAPIRAALGGRDTGGLLALAQGALVVDGPGAPYRGVVAAVRTRRGRAEPTVRVDGIGLVTAQAPATWWGQVDDEVALAVDPSAVAALPG